MKDKMNEKRILEENAYASLVKKYLSLSMYDNAVFLAERMVASCVPSSSRYLPPSSSSSSIYCAVYLLATCHHRAGRPGRARGALLRLPYRCGQSLRKNCNNEDIIGGERSVDGGENGVNDRSSSILSSHYEEAASYLLSKCCFELGLFSEAEEHLLRSSRDVWFRIGGRSNSTGKGGGGDGGGGNGETKDFDSYLLNSEPSFVPRGAAGLALLGDVMKKGGGRNARAARFYRRSLQLDPFLWTSYESLCEMGQVDPDLDDPATVFGGVIPPGLSSIPRSRGGYLDIDDETNRYECNNEITTETNNVNRGDIFQSMTDKGYPSLGHLDSPTLAVEAAVAEVTSGVTIDLGYDFGVGSTQRRSGTGNVHVSSFLRDPSTLTPAFDDDSAIIDNSGDDGIPATALFQTGSRRRTVVDPGAKRRDNGRSIATPGGRVSSPSPAVRRSGLPSAALFRTPEDESIKDRDMGQRMIPFLSDLRGTSTIDQYNQEVEKNEKKWENVGSGQKMDQSTMISSRDTINPLSAAMGDNVTKTVIKATRGRDEVFNVPLEPESDPLAPPSFSSTNTIKKNIATFQPILSLLCTIGSAQRLLSRYRCADALLILRTLPPSQYNTAHVLHQVGRAYFESADYRNARSSLEAMMRVDPHRTRGLELLSTALWHLKEEVALSDLAQRAVDLDRNSPEAWCVVGNCFSLQREHELALCYFRRSIQLDPTFAYYRTLVGHEFVSNEDLDGAVSCYRDAIRIDDRHYNAWYGLGAIFFRQEQYDLAEYHFKRALSIHPGSSVLHCHLGMAQHAAGRPNDALKTLAGAFSIDPSNTQARFQKANVWMSMDRPEEALSELKKVRDAAPREAQVHFAIGRVWKRMGRQEKAMRCFLTAMDLEPKDNNLIKVAMDRLDEPDVDEDVSAF